MMQQSDSRFIPDYTQPLMKPVITKIGGTYYEATSHFSAEGKETLLEQFLTLLKEGKQI